MTGRPTYLDALARAADWQRPADDGSDAARPRPRPLFEPDGLESAASGLGWAETAVEVEAPSTVAPTSARAHQAAGVQPTEDAPSVTRPEPLRPVTEPAAPSLDAAPHRVAALPAAEEVAAREPAGPAMHLDPAEPTRRPSPPVVEPREAVPAETAASHREPAPAAEQRAVPRAPAAGTPVERPEPIPAREPAPPPEAGYEARPVARPVDVVTAEEPTPREPEATDGPTVVVEIGRIEVRLASEPGPARRPAVLRPAPGPSLADYLQARSAGEGRPA